MADAPSIRFSCPHCDARLSAGRDAEGTRVRCKACGRGVAVPMSLDDDDFGDDPPPSRRRTGPSLAVLVSGAAAAVAVVAILGIGCVVWRATTGRPDAGGGGGGGGGGGTGATEADRLPKILADIRAVKEPARGGRIPLPEAIGLLHGNAGKFENLTVQTYSVNFNEDRLTKAYGPPDEVGRETAVESNGFGTTQNTYRMIRYGWLKFLVTPEGEIAHVRKR